MTKHFMHNAVLARLLALQMPAAIIGSPRMEADPTAVLADLRNELGRINGEFAKKLDIQARKIETLETRNQDLEQMVSGQRHFSGRGDSPESWGFQVTNSEAFAAIKGKKVDGTFRFTVENAITTATGSGGALVRRDTRTDPIQLPRRRLTIRDLLNPGQTGSNMVEYARQTVRTNNAAMVSEGSQKPESIYAWSREEAKVRTIAHWVPVSRQAMDDSDQLRSVIDGELRYGVDIKEEGQLLAGDGTGENLEGLISSATAFSPPFSSSGDTDIDVVLQAKAQLGAPGSEIIANGVVLNSLDWERMTGIKDGEDRYIGAGPFGNTPEVLWRLPVVASNSMPEGEFLVGDFRRAATIYDRMDLEVLISSEDRDNFIKNMLTVRAEKRLALAITMPQAMVYGTLPSAGS